MTTKKEDTQKLYFESINTVVQYINDHLDEKLDLNQLAQLGHYSQYHFHRIMRAYLGESLGAYIVRIRLETTVHLLKMTDIPVGEIALKVGYENPTSLNKAFKKRFGISPGEYRSKHDAQLQIIQPQLKIKIMNHLTSKPKIKEEQAKKVIYAQSLGAYNESAGKAWNTICKYAKEKRLFGFKTEFIGISHDDPNVTEKGKLRYDACLSISKDITPEGEIGVQEIAAGKYAIFTHKGPYENFQSSYDYIFGSWVPENGIELRDAPCYEKYLNNPENAKPEKLKTEIYVPIQ